MSEQSDAKIMPAARAEAVLGAWDGRKVTLASAKPIVVAWMRAQGWSEDRYGNFKLAADERWHFAKQVVRRERNLGDYWQATKSLPMIDMATNLLASASKALGRDEEYAKVSKARVARREEKKERRTKAEEVQFEEEIVVRALKYLSQEMPEGYVAYKSGKTPDEFKARADEIFAQVKKQMTGGGHFSDGEIAASDTPPIGPFFDKRLAFTWNETFEEVPYTISVMPGERQSVSIHIGRPSTGHLGLVDPVRHQVQWSGGGENRVGDGYLSGQVQRYDGKPPIGALFFIIAHESKRGAGSRLLDLWCTMMSAYGVNRWLVQAAGDQGQAFVDARARAGRLEILGRSGKDIVVRCLDAAHTAPEKFMPNGAVAYSAALAAKFEPFFGPDNARELAGNFSMMVDLNPELDAGDMLREALRSRRRVPRWAGVDLSLDNIERVVAAFLGDDALRDGDALREDDDE